MRFMIERNWNKPCDHAKWERYMRIDVRATDDPTKIPCFAGHPDDAREEWFGKGVNHRLENGQITRDLEHSAWFIDLPDFAALLALMSAYGDMTIKPSDSVAGEPLIHFEE